MRIGTREVGPGHPVYIIAELGVNHDGSVERALELTRGAAAAGADAIKLQYFETDRLMSKSAKLAAYQKAAGETDPVAMLRRLEFSIEQMKPVVALAHELGLHAIVTVFSTELVDRAESLVWDAYKTASPDIVHKPLLERLARTGRPLIVSTGAAKLDEIRTSLAWLGEWGASRRLALLQCVSSYPTPMEQAALGGIGALRGVFEGPVGYSDHTSTTRTGAAAVARGATMLEKHLTYSKRATGPDHAASLEPAELAEYVRLVREAAHRPGAAAMGGSEAVEKRVLPIEEDVRRVSRQSVVARRDLREGEVVSASDVTIKRPGTGVPAADLARVMGMRIVRAVAADTVIAWEDVR